MRRWGGRSMSLSTDKDMPGTGHALLATSETPMAYYTVLVAGGCFASLFKIGQTLDWLFLPLATENVAYKFCWGATERFTIKVHKP